MKPLASTLSATFYKVVASLGARATFLFLIAKNKNKSGGGGEKSDRDRGGRGSVERARASRVLAGEPGERSGAKRPLWAASGASAERGARRPRSFPAFPLVSFLGRYALSPRFPFHILLIFLKVCVHSLSFLFLVSARRGLVKLLGAVVF